MLLLTLLFISTAVATPLLGTEQCARGPPYWCKNVKTASQCGAVAHCTQNVWNQPQMKSVPCDLCKEVMIVVSQILKDNATESEILGYLEKACQLIPDQSLTAECKEMVDSYYPIIIGIITGELEDPAVVCGAIGLCQSQQAALAKVHAKEQLMSNEIPQVDLSQRVAPFLLNVPGLLYPQESVKEDTKVETPKVETPKQCKEYISEYGAVVVQQLMSMQPKEICAHAGFCAEMKKKSVPMMTLMAAKMVPAAKSVPAVKLIPATKVEAATDKSAKRMVRVRESPKCSICEFVMKELEDMLKDEATEEEVIQAVEKVCTVLPSTLSAQCKDLIETYGSAIIELLVQQADPKTVCTVLGLCNDPSRAFVVALDQTRFDAGGYCQVCKMAVEYIDGILEKNATEAQIEEAVRKACSFLPDAFRTECDQMVEQYEPMLIQLLLQMLEPDFVCMAVAHCKRHVWV
ncbi:prosaposin isoform X2 [Xyrichtys novacula]|uniref:Prosaposin isoform X2 n=1 Tax=Xyrichtys novacula TaxID=13765 RepID=A0AAV1G2P1_XYRNO|nr:prosaposin isoform X2 [Xyrichtys novacula]